MMPKNLSQLAQQRGQALVESIIAISTVLLAMVILIPLLGKYVESVQKTDQAARYSAWERTVWFQSAPSGTSNAAVKSNEEMQREIHWRFFSDDNVVLSSKDSTSNQRWTVANNLNPMLGTRQSHGQGVVSLLDNGNANNNGNSADELITLTTTNKESKGVSGILNNFLSLFQFGGFSVSSKGLYTSQVEYAYAELPGIEPFDKSLNINPKSEVVIQADGWNTSGRNHNVRMVRGLTPSTLFDQGIINTVRNGIGWLPFAKEIRTSSLKFGHVDTEQLPQQRLCTVSGNRCQ